MKLDNYKIPILILLSIIAIIIYLNPFGFSVMVINILKMLGLIICGLILIFTQK